MKCPSIFAKNKLSEQDQPDDLAPDQDIGQDETICGLTDLYVPQEQTSVDTEQSPQPHVRDILDVLLEIEKLTEQQNLELRQKVRDSNNKTGSNIEALISDSGLVDPVDILKAKAQLHELEFVTITPETVEAEVFEKLDLDFIKSNNIIPIGIEGETLVIATTDPSNVFAIESVKRHTQMDTRVVVCCDDDIKAICEQFEEEKEKIDYCVDDIINDMADVELVQEEENDLEDLEQMAGKSPVIKFVNYLISNAIHEKASDIHIEPKIKFTQIRYRIDGVLFKTMQSPLKMHPAIISRIKIMSNLDISERRLPQDGKISIIVGGRGIDLRVSTLPTSHGEKIVIRILDSKTILLGLEELGMEPETTAAFKEQILLPHGILLVTGPTGSGKSTTLYSALTQMDGDRLNISTVEDPVEYELDFCNQVQANERVGLTFSVALRSFLRQDPDIIMVGEIRDNQTAKIAVQAALTGHLVLSTLHTNDAASSVTRLINIGVDAYLIAASLNAVLAQRLVRKICPKCKELYQAPENMRKHLEQSGVAQDQLYHGVGCDFCRNSGYAGRVGIYELMIIDENFKDMINKDSSVTNMRQAFIQSKQPSLFDDGIQKIKKGLTTIEEVLRVTEVYGQIETEVAEQNNEQQAEITDNQ